MSCDTMVAILKTKLGDYCIWVDDNENLVICRDYYTKEDIYSENFKYKPPIGMAIDDIFVENMKPLYDIEYTFKTDIEKEKYIHSVIIETKYSFLLRNEINMLLTYAKRDIEFYNIHLEDNLKYIDEL